MSIPQHATFPNGWNHSKLSELITLESGSRPRDGVKGILEGVPSLGGEHLNDKGKFHFNKMKYISEGFFASLNQGQICPNDILIVKDGATTGKTSFVDADFPYEYAAVNEHLFIVRVLSKLALPKFIFYHLFSNKGQASIRLDFRGVTVGGITRNFSTKVDIPLPPLPEQRRIVAKIEELFTKLDAGINALYQAQSQLKRYRQSVLKAAFEGKLTQAWREGHQDKIESSLPTAHNLPDRWTRTTLKEVSELNPRMDKQSIDDNLEITFLPMKNVEALSGKIDLSETKQFSELKTKSYTPFQDGDILFAKVTPCMENGKIAILHNLKNGIGFGSTEFHVIRLSEDQSKQFFFFYPVHCAIARVFLNKPLAPLT